jgi:hypothetical protein
MQTEKNMFHRGPKAMRVKTVCGDIKAESTNISRAPGWESKAKLFSMYTAECGRHLSRLYDVVSYNYASFKFLNFGFSIS